MGAYTPGPGTPTRQARVRRRHRVRASAMHWQRQLALLALVAVGSSLDLTMRTATDQLPGSAVSGLAQRVFNNTALSGQPSATSIVPSLSLHLSQEEPFSAEVTGVLTFPATGRYNIECNISAGATIAFVWLDDHEVCVSGAYDNGITDRSSMDGSPAYPLIITDQMANSKQVVRIQLWSPNSTVSTPAEITVLWRTCSCSSHRNCSCPGELTEIPGSALTPDLPALEQQRRAFQKPIVNGWATWHPHNYLSFLHLPDASQISLMICQLSEKLCLTASYGPDDGSNTLRPSLHAIDRSYAEYSVNAFRAPVGLNISVRWSGGGDSLRVMVSPVDCVTKTSIQNCSDFAVVFSTDFAWSRAGASSAGCGNRKCHLNLAPYGLTSHSLQAMMSRDIATAAKGCDVTGFKENPPGVRPLPPPGSGLTIRLDTLNNSNIYLTTENETWQQTAAVLDKAEAAERRSLQAYGDHAGEFFRPTSYDCTLLTILCILISYMVYYN